nr:hypothetical protein CR513_38765 [Ipomoea batatas]
MRDFLRLTSTLTKKTTEYDLTLLAEIKNEMDALMVFNVLSAPVMVPSFGHMIDDIKEKPTHKQWRRHHERRNAIHSDPILPHLHPQVLRHPHHRVLRRQVRVRHFSARHRGGAGREYHAPPLRRGHHSRGVLRARERAVDVDVEHAPEVVVVGVLDALVLLSPDAGVAEHYVQLAVLGDCGVDRVLDVLLERDVAVDVAQGVCVADFVAD